MIYKPGKSNYVADALSRLKVISNHLYSSTTDTASEGRLLDSEDTRTASEGNVSAASDTETASEGRRDDDLSSDATIHSADQDSTDLIPHVEAPINVFRNQIIIKIGIDMTVYEEPHRGYARHFIALRQWSEDTLIAVLKEKLRPNIVN